MFFGTEPQELPFIHYGISDDRMGMDGPTSMWYFGWEDGSECETTMNKHTNSTKKTGDLKPTPMGICMKLEVDLRYVYSSP